MSCRKYRGVQQSEKALGRLSVNTSSAWQERLLFIW